MGAQYKGYSVLYKTQSLQLNLRVRKKSRRGSIKPFPCIVTNIYRGQLRRICNDSTSEPITPFPVPVFALYLGVATWVQPSHPASPRPSSVFGANLVLTRRLLSSLPLSAAVRQFWCNGRWYERSDLWYQLAGHRRCHRLSRYGHNTRLDSLPSPHFHGLGPPRPGGSRGVGKPREDHALCLNKNCNQSMLLTGLHYQHRRVLA